MVVVEIEFKKKTLGYENTWEIDVFDDQFKGKTKRYYVSTTKPTDKVIRRLKRECCSRARQAQKG